MPNKITRGEAISSGTGTMQYLTLGTVVDNNDPQQMGRVRVLCPSWGDSGETPMNDLPWAQYCTPFGGVSPNMSRGPEDIRGGQAIAYGMWAIPKVGSNVLVVCPDGNPVYRYYIGSVYGQDTTHTLPMGRFLDEGKRGPLSGKECPIEPASTNLRRAFSNNNGDQSHEWQSRAAEYQAAGIKSNIIDDVPSKEPDDPERAYQVSRSVVTEDEANQIYDPQNYSLTTPGGHMLLMDDSVKNGRIRLRTTSGNQVILDDTDERIYISTPEGNNWIEMDRNGNIDIHSDRRISVHASNDINFKTEKSFRVEASDIHMKASNDFRVHSEDVHIRTDNDFNVRASNDINLCGLENTKIEAQNGLHLKATEDWIGSGSTVSLNSEEDIKFGIVATIPDGGTGIGTVSDVVDMRIVQTLYPPTPGAPKWEIQFHSSSLDFSGGNPPPFYKGGGIIPDDADSACDSTVNFAYAPNRVPQHEAWGRIMVDPSFSDVDTAPNSSTTLELSYDSSSVGKVELGESISRNANWRR